MKTRHNPERRAWRGKSHKKGGKRVKQLRWAGTHCKQVWPLDTPPDVLPSEDYKLGDSEACICDNAQCRAIVVKA